MNLSHFIRFFSLVSAAAFSLTCVSTQAATLVQLDDDGTANSADPLPVLFATTGLTSTPATQVGLDTSLTDPTSWPVGPWTSSTIDPDVYISVTITPDPGMSIDYDNIVLRKGFFGPTIDEGTIRTSLDNFTLDVSTADAAAASIFNPDQPSPLVIFDVSPLTEVTSAVEFRFYFTNSDPTSSSGTAFTNISTLSAGGFGILFNGTIVPVPEPGSLVLLTLGGVVILLRR